jgi:hypothetical protein
MTDKRVPREQCKHLSQQWTIGWNDTGAKGSCVECGEDLTHMHPLTMPAATAVPDERNGTELVHSSYVADTTREILALRRDRDALRVALRLVLDQVDYTNGACGATNMVGACLPTKVIDIARAALATTKD